MRMAVSLGVGIAMGVVLARPATVDACTVANSPPFEVDSESTDVQAPPPPDGVAVEIRRLTEGTCEGTTLLLLSVDVPAGTPADELGVRLAVVEGTANVPSDPLIGPDVQIYWAAERGDVTLAVRRVDRAGNESAPVLVRVPADGDGGGCRVAPAGRAAGSRAWAVFVVLALAIAGRRHRRTA